MNNFTLKVNLYGILHLLFILIQEGTTIRQAMSESSDMIQPGILQIGKDYLIKIETNFIHVPNCKLDHAIAYVVGFYYCFEIDYPAPQKFVFLFWKVCSRWNCLLRQ